MTLSLDTSNQVSSSSSPITIPITTTKGSGQIVVCIASGAASVSSVAGAGLTFNQEKAGVTSGSWSLMDIYSAPYTTNFSGNITVTLSAASFTTITVFAVGGADTTSNVNSPPYDSNVSLPALSAAGAASGTTSNSTDFVFAFCGTGSTDTATGAWTLMPNSGSNFVATLYQITSSTGTYTASTTGGVFGSLVDAIVQASTATSLTATNLATGAAGFANSEPIFSAFTPIWLNTWVLDNGLLGLDANSDSIYICSQQPVDFTTATSTYGLGSYSFGIGNVFPGSPTNGTPNGRVMTSNAITAGSVTANGTPTYWAIVDTANSRLLATGNLSGGVALTTSNQFALSAITVHIPSQ